MDLFCVDTLERLMITLYWQVLKDRYDLFDLNNIYFDFQE